MEDIRVDPEVEWEGPVSHRLVLSTFASPGRWEVRILLGHEAWNPFVCEWSDCKRMQLKLSQIHGAAPLPWSTPSMMAAAVEV